MRSRLLAIAITTFALVATAEPASATSVVTDVSYGRARQQRYDVCMPATGTSRATVLIIHGGGFVSGDKRDFRATCRWFADRGWVAVALNYRFATTTNAGIPQFDVRAATTHVRQRSRRFGIDPARIAAFGSSAGGNLAGILATRGTGSRSVGSRVIAAVSWSGPMLLAEAPTSPYHWVDATDAPMYLVGSTNELVPSWHQTLMHDRLVDAGVTQTQLLLVPGRQHAGQLTDEAWTPSITFLEQFLGPLAD